MGYDGEDMLQQVSIRALARAVARATYSEELQVAEFPGAGEHAVCQTWISLGAQGIPEERTYGRVRAYAGHPVSTW